MKDRKYEALGSRAKKHNSHTGSARTTTQRAATYDFGNGSASDGAFFVADAGAYEQTANAPHAFLKQYAISTEDKQRLDDLYKHFTEGSQKHMGYQGNLLYDYADLYRFLAFTINNVGDPFVDGIYKINTHAFEREVISFFADLYHAQKGTYWGYITNGGTEGNMYGLYLAREQLPNGIVYYSKDAHYSIAKAQRLMKFPAVVVSSQPHGEMNYRSLIRAIKKHNKPPIIVATIGTTMHGAIDRVEKIVEALKRNGITKYYIHCDAALGGMVLPFIKDAPLFDFRLPIGSISVSGHKMVGCPIPCGVVIAHKEHIERVQRDIEITGTPDTTLPGSRNGHTALFLWYALRKFGYAGFARLVESCFDVRNYAMGRFEDAGLNAHSENFSIIIVINRPPEHLVHKWQLAVEGDKAHLVVMPNVTKKHIDGLIADLLAV